MLRITTALSDRYRIEREIGAGGMATVYLAEDLKHKRKVAIKVLKPELAAVLGAERFVQEITTTATLQHQHILPLFDSGDAGGFLFYVMPYIEGETLHTKLGREKQLGIDESVRITREVADALDYAHRNGVIHRDIKPENILLHNGSVLVADFGIALAASKAGTRMTETGMSLGTPQYMSPEQAMGERELDARSDVYALGCVLYEMLIGEPPFTGPTAQAIVAKVMTSEPAPLRAERKTIPPHLEAAVLQALEKLPADRFAGAADFGAALGNPAFTSRRAIASSAAHPLAPAMARLPWVLLVSAIGFIVVAQFRPTALPLPPVQRFDIVLPPNALWVGDILSGLAFSPDGTMLAYNGQDSSGQRQLYLRPLDQHNAIPISGSEDGQFPFFSPDGRWVGYRVGNRIVKTPVRGGSPETVCETNGAGLGTWLESNTVVFTDSVGLRQCSTAGRATTLLGSGPNESFTFPHSMPDDRAVLFTIQRGAVNRLAVLDLRTNALKLLDIFGSDPRYVGTGHLVYVSADGMVRAAPFDPKGLAITGESVIIPENVRVEFGVAQMALSRTGAMVLAHRSSPLRGLELVDRNGRAERLYPRLAEFADPRFSPDGRRIALSVGASIWLFDRAQGTLTRLSFDSAASRPVWSPDGRRVAYLRHIGRTSDVRLMNADGSTSAQSLPSLDKLEPWEVLFTPDGRSVVVRTVERSGSRDIWLASLDSTSQPVPLLQSPANEVAPALSANGRWLAYVSGESGRAEVYVRSFPSMGGRFTVSLDGGTEPVWSPRGNELFFRNGSTLIAAAVRAGNSFEVLRRTSLFTNSTYGGDLTHQVYDVAPDGQHFVMVREMASTGHLRVTLHQFENLGNVNASAVPTSRER